MDSRQRVSGRRPAAAAARSKRTISRPRFICRRRSRPAISTSSPMRWCAKSRSDRSGQGTRRRLHRQDTGRGREARGPRGGARGELGRVGAHPAEFEVGTFPDGLANSSGTGRQVPHGYGRQPRWADRFRCWRTCRRTTKTAPAAITCTFRGGCIRSNSPASSISRAAITSSSAPAATCRASATAAGLEWLTGGSYGRQFKEDARRYYGSVRVLRRPRRDDPERRFVTASSIRQVKDRWGIPVLRFHWKWSDHETRQAAHMQTDLCRDHRGDGRHA